MGLALSGEGERYLYLRWDPERQRALLSDGTPLPPGVNLVPGQYVEWEEGRWKGKNTWQPPQDLVKTWTPREAGRVVFSHERHFAALGAKGSTCQTCHASLDRGKAWPSSAPSPALEPHGRASLGRFCATCHDGKTLPGTLQGSQSPLKAPLFRAWGRKGEGACNQCHAPQDHGLDFTAIHGKRVERQGTRMCAACHRGATQLAPQERAWVQAFYRAQLALIRNPDDEKAFNQVLPPNFCAYCHGLDGKAWKGKD
nr:cytochrome c3 family protein [Thermus thalpophilus]